MKLHTNGSGTALPKDFFLSETRPESKIQRTKVLICVNNKNSFDRGEKPQRFPCCKASLTNKKLSSTINESTNHIDMETNYGKLKSTDGA